MLRRHLFLVGLLGGFIGCQSSEKDANLTKKTDSALAAKVNGEGITKQSYEDTVSRTMARYQKKGHKLPPGIEDRVKESVLRRMIDNVVLSQKATQMKITVSATDVDKKFNEQKSRFRTEEAFEQYLTRSSNTEENLKDDLRLNLLKEQVVQQISGDIVVNDAEVKKYFEDNASRFAEKERVKVSRILIRVAKKAAAAEEAKAKKTSDSAYKKAMQTGADFAALAKEFSQGAEAQRGGELNWIYRSSKKSQEFKDAVFNTPVNKISKVYKTNLGYEFIKVLEKKEKRQKEFAEVSKVIHESLLGRERNKKRQEVLRELKGNAKVEQFIKFERGAPKPGKAQVSSPQGKLRGKIKDRLKKAEVNLKPQEPQAVN